MTTKVTAASQNKVPTVTNLETAAAIARVDGHPLQAAAFEFAVKTMAGALVKAANKVAKQLGRPELFEDIHSEAVIALWGLLKSWKPAGGSSPSSYIITFLTHHVRKRVLATLPIVRIPHHALEAGERTYMTSIDAPTSDDEDGSLVDTLIAPGRTPEQWAIGNQIIGRLAGCEAGEMFLGTLAGHTTMEIGAVYGVGSSRVNQRVAHVKMGMQSILK